MLLPQSYQYPNLSEGADCVGGQLRGDKEYPFSGVTKSGRLLEESAGKRCSECGVGAEAPEGSERRGLWEQGFGKQRGVRS